MNVSNPHKHVPAKAPCFALPVLRLRCSPRRNPLTLLRAAEGFEVGEQSAAPQPSISIPVRMNATPHSRELRRYFYNDVARATVSCLAAKQTRMKVRVTIPELNPEMDVYRVGTLMEMVREMATQIAEDGKRVKVCVQGSMGQGVFQALPLSLNGVARIMHVMDWGNVADFVSFGEVGAKDVDEADVYLLLCPQNIVGSMIMTNLSEMVNAAEDVGKSVVLVNPILKDVPSANGVMGVRGRAGRLEFNDSFLQAYHFRLLYWGGSFYPIIGALRFAYGGKWQVFKRIDLTNTDEEYQLWGEFASQPVGGDITKCFQNKLPLQLRGLEPAKAEKRAKWW